MSGSWDCVISKHFYLCTCTRNISALEKQITWFFLFLILFGHFWNINLYCQLFKNYQGLLLRAMLLEYFKNTFIKITTHWGLLQTYYKHLTEYSALYLLNCRFNIRICRMCSMPNAHCSCLLAPAFLCIKISHSNQTMNNKFPISKDISSLNMGKIFSSLCSMDKQWSNFKI